MSWSVEQLLGQTRDALTVKRVFGEAYEKNGVSIIPVASVRGTAGGGGGGDNEGNGGNGGGVGLSARPMTVTTVATPPEVGLNEVTVGWTLKLNGLHDISVGVATATGPVRAPFGTVAVIFPPETTW